MTTDEMLALVQQTPPGLRVAQASLQGEEGMVLCFVMRGLDPRISFHFPGRNARRENSYLLPP
jgi:hypothetical protein